MFTCFHSRLGCLPLVPKASHSRLEAPRQPKHVVRKATQRGPCSHGRGALQANTTPLWVEGAGVHVQVALWGEPRASDGEALPTPPRAAPSPFPGPSTYFRQATPCTQACPCPPSSCLPKPSASSPPLGYPREGSAWRRRACFLPSLHTSLVTWLQSQRGLESSQNHTG